MKDEDSILEKGYHSDTNKRSKKIFTESHEVTINSFDFLALISKGAYGRVWLVRKIASGDLYAMKIIDFAERMTDNLFANIKNESDIFGMVNGEFVVKAAFTFVHENYICFVMEYMMGGDLGALLERFGVLDESTCRFYLAELVLAIESIHSINIVHRDLKPDNVLIDRRGHIKLSDFGLSEYGVNYRKRNSTPLLRSERNSPRLDDVIARKKLDKFNKLCPTPSPTVNKVSSRISFVSQSISLMPRTSKIKVIRDDLSTPSPGRGGTLSSFNWASSRGNVSSREDILEDSKPKRIVGTPDYIAPEIIKGDSMASKTLDWWSFGVIAYELLCGLPPFNDNTVEKIFENIMSLTIVWPDIGEEEGCMSAAAKDLISKLLVIDPTKRLGTNSAYEIKNHPFFKDVDWHKVRESTPPVIPVITEDTDTSQFYKETKKFTSDELKNPFGAKTNKNWKTANPKYAKEIHGLNNQRLDVLHQLNQKEYDSMQKAINGQSM
jgi:serine/threonine protein kinase